VSVQISCWSYTEPCYLGASQVYVLGTVNDIYRISTKLFYPRHWQAKCRVWASISTSFRVEAYYSNSDSRSCVEVRDRSGQQNGQGPSMPHDGHDVDHVTQNRFCTFRICSAPQLQPVSWSCRNIASVCRRVSVIYWASYLEVFHDSLATRKTSQPLQVRPHLQNTSPGPFKLPQHPLTVI